MKSKNNMVILPCDCKCCMFVVGKKISKLHCVTIYGTIFLGELNNY